MPAHAIGVDVALQSAIDDRAPSRDRTCRTRFAAPAAAPVQRGSRRRRTVMAMAVIRIGRDCATGSAPAGSRHHEGREVALSCAHGTDPSLCSPDARRLRGGARGTGAARHHAEGGVRLQLRRRLSARHLPAARRLLAEARSRVGSHGPAGDRQDLRGPAAPDGDRHVAREPQEPRALSRTSRGGSRSPRA